MHEDKYVLGIDTSNYKTSVAVTSLDGRIITDERRLLEVNRGELGLRQSHAFFQHVNAIPTLVQSALCGIERGDICAVAVSVRPRPEEGSYMPVFRAGRSAALTLASALEVPVYEFSHQEGHIAAVKKGSRIDGERTLLAYHLSGGTSELVTASKTDRGFDIRLCGGSLDIAYGQVLDRVGVSMGLQFPAGAELDEIALAAGKATGKRLKPIPLKGAYVNLSGIETQCGRITAAGDGDPQLIAELFEKIAVSIEKSVCRAAEDTGLKKVIFAGGVAESGYIRDKLQKDLRSKGIEPAFGSASLSQDNAVGVAFLGGEAYEADKGFSA